MQCWVLFSWSEQMNLPLHFLSLPLWADSAYNIVSTNSKEEILKNPQQI